MRQYDPRRVGEPVALAIGGVQLVIATTHTHLVAEVGTGEFTGLLGGQAAIGASQTIGHVAEPPPCLRELIALGGHIGLRGGAFNGGTPFFRAKGTQQPPIGHAILIVVTQRIEIGLGAAHGEGGVGVAREIFGLEDGLEGDILPLGGIGGSLSTARDEGAVENQDALIKALIGGEQRLKVGVAGTPLIEEGVLRVGDRGVVGGRCTAGGEGHRLHGHRGATRLGKRIIGVGFAEGPPEVRIIGRGGLVAPANVTRGGHGGILDGVEGEELRGLQRELPLARILPHRGIGHREEPRRRIDRVGVSEGDQLGAQGAAHATTRPTHLVIRGGATIEAGNFCNLVIPSSGAHDARHGVIIGIEEGFDLAITIVHLNDQIIGEGIDHLEGEVEGGASGAGGRRVGVGDHRRTVLDNRLHHALANIVGTGNHTRGVAALGDEERPGELRGGAIRQGRGITEIGERIVIDARHIEVGRGGASRHIHNQGGTSAFEHRRPLRLKLHILRNNRVDIAPIGEGRTFGDFSLRIAANGEYLELPGRGGGGHGEGILQEVDGATIGIGGISRRVILGAERAGIGRGRQLNGLTLRRRDHLEVIGLIHRAIAIQLRNANAEVAGAIAGGARNGQLDHIAIDIGRIQGHIVALELRVGTIGGRDARNGGEEGAPGIEVGHVVLGDQEVNRFASGGIDCAALHREAMKRGVREARDRQRERAIHALIQLGGDHHVAGGIGMRGQGRLAQVQRVAGKEGLRGAVRGLHTIAEAHLAAGRNRGRNVHKVGLRGKGRGRGIIGAIDFGGEVTIICLRDGGRVVALGDDGVGGFEGRYASGSELPRGRGVIIDFHPKGAIAREARAGEGGGGSILARGDGDRHQALIELVLILIGTRGDQVATFIGGAHGEGIAADRHRIGGVFEIEVNPRGLREGIALHHAGGGGGHARPAHRHLDEANIAAEARIGIGPRAHPGDAIAHVTGADGIGEA